MNIKKSLILAIALATTSLSGFATIANAATYAEKDGVAYVTEWENYDYVDGFEGTSSLKDYLGMSPTFAQNENSEWVSTPLTVTGSEISGYPLKYFTFEFNSEDVSVYDYETGERITNRFIQHGQKIYIVSKDDPMNLRMKFTPILIAEN